MYYVLCDHIYVAQFKDELILLDTKRDRYVICSHEISKLLLDLLEKKRISTKGFSCEGRLLQEQYLLKKLIDDSIIEEKKTAYLFYIDKKINSEVGVSNVDWRLPLENKGISLNFSVIKALMTLLQVNFYMKVKGFYSTVRLIRKSCKRRSSYIIPQDEELKNLVNIVNKACLIYPTRTKCLEWAITFVLLALKKKWRCNLEIGVHNYPFFAHAWVECSGKVIMDSQDLREGLSIILNEPFRV